MSFKKYVYLSTLVLVGLILQGLGTASLPHTSAQTEYTNIRDAEWSPDGDILAVVFEGQIVFYDSQLNIINQLDWLTRDVEWKPDGTRLVSIGMNISIFDTSNLSNITRLLTIERLAIPSSHNTADWHPTANQLAVANERLVQIWNTDSGELSQEFETEGTVLDVKWSPSSNYLAVSGINQPITIWDVQSEQQIKIYQQDSADPIAWNSNSDSLAAVSNFNTLYIWSLASDSVVANLTVGLERELLRTLDWGKYGLLAAYSSNTIRIWDTTNYQLILEREVAGSSTRWRPEHQEIVIWGINSKMPVVMNPLERGE